MYSSWERRELLRDSRRHEKGVTRIIGEYLPIEHRTEKKKRCRGWDKRVLQESEKGGQRERDWVGLRVLAKSSAIISAWYPPVYVRQKWICKNLAANIYGEHLYVYVGFQKMKPTRTGAVLPLAKLQVEYVCQGSIFIDLYSIQWVIQYCKIL